MGEKRTVHILNNNLKALNSTPLWSDNFDEKNSVISFLKIIGFCLLAGFVPLGNISHLLHGFFGKSTNLYISLVGNFSKFLFAVNRKEFSIEHYMEDVQNITEGMSIFYTIFCFLWKRQEIKKLIREFEDVKNFSIPKDFEKSHKRIESLSSAFINYVYFAGIPFGLYKYMQKEKCKMKNLTETKPDVVCGLIFNTWVPLNIKETPFTEIYFFIQFVSILIFGKTIISIYALVFALVEHLIIRIKHLKYLIKNIRLEVDSKKKGDALKACLQYHHRIIS